jgi:hypothetical protein
VTNKIKQVKEKGFLRQTKLGKIVDRRPVLQEMLKEPGNSGSLL